MAKNVLMRKVASFLCQAAQLPRIIFFKMLSNNNSIGKATYFQPLQLVGFGSISFDRNVRIGIFPSQYFFSTYAYIEARNKDASVYIGENTWVNNNFSAIAEHTYIKIGKNCLIGVNVEIFDSNFHGLNVSQRAISLPESAAPVIIGDDVFIGNNVRIMKGVTIGDGAVVGNSSLVTSNVPANTLVAGIPAKIIRVID